MPSKSSREARVAFSPAATSALEGGGTCGCLALVIRFWTALEQQAHGHNILICLFLLYHFLGTNINSESMVTNILINLPSLYQFIVTLIVITSRRLFGSSPRPRPR